MVIIVVFYSWFLFLLEKPIRISEYVFNDNGHLCHTANFQWQQDVDVHVVVASKTINACILMGGATRI